MRQVGVLAAAGLYALDHHLERLAEDHAHARLLADAVAARPAGVVDPATRGDQHRRPRPRRAGLAAADVAAAAAEHGVLVSALGPRLLRLVTHLDVDDDACEHAAGVLAKVLA